MRCKEQRAAARRNKKREEGCVCVCESVLITGVAVGLDAAVLAETETTKSVREQQADSDTEHSSANLWSHRSQFAPTVPLMQEPATQLKGKMQSKHTPVCVCVCVCVSVCLRESWQREQAKESSSKLSNARTLGLGVLAVGHAGLTAGIHLIRCVVVKVHAVVTCAAKENTARERAEEKECKECDWDGPGRETDVAVHRCLAVFAGRTPVVKRNTQ
jgi:hypothetical protein